VARLTPFGWTAFGPVNNNKDEDTIECNFIETENLCDIVKQAWELEAIGINEEPILQSVKNQEENDINYQYNDKKYFVKAMWLEGCPNLHNNKEKVHNLSRRIKENSEYQAKLSEYELKGYIRELPTQVEEQQDECWYLPHFSVRKKGDSKLRIVFNCAARINGECLNDQLSKGTKIIADIFDVLLKFRWKKIALAGDIREMYLQFHIADDDKKYFRFLWNGRAYEWQRLIFGRRDAPYIAIRLLKLHAQRFISVYPKAANVILTSTYVDDIVTSCNTIEEANELQQQLIEMFQEASMEIKQWCIGGTDSTLKNEINFQDNVEEQRSTLGVKWKSQSDELSYSCNIPVTKHALTKRQVLSFIARIFDPLGLLDPVLVRAKILFQKTWVLNLEWDDELPAHFQKLWTEILNDISELNIIRIPRYVGYTTGANIKVHIFGDASTEAYSTVAYVRVTHETGGNCSILCARSKVTPLKSKSIPRLELIAATISTRMARRISSIFNLNLKTDFKFWTDSTNVLYWISQPGKIFKTYVSNRVGEIQERTNTEQWRYCPTNLNPADISTRGISVRQLKDNVIWLNGPPFLSLHEDNWPIKKVITTTKETDCELKRDCLTCMSTVVMEEEFVLNPKKWSRWNPYVKRLSYVIKFICRLRKQNWLLSFKDIAELKIIELCQNKYFPNEIYNLRKNEPIKRTSSLLRLNPFLDENNVLRSKSRIEHAEWLRYDTRYPIILPKRSEVTRLIITYYHDVFGHAVGRNCVINEVNKRYWILHIRESIRFYEKQCSKCCKAKAVVSMPIMGALPKLRVTAPFHTFSKVGVDYAGPYFTIAGRGKPKHKRYMCLFTCMLTRAAHLEVAFSLDTNSFLNCFSRFCDRRGTPSEVISDNGSNFTRAEKELSELVKTLNWETMAQKYVKIIWTFNPPTASHFGGSFERLIRSAKRAFSAVIEHTQITDEELATLFTGVERLLNTRPICIPSADEKDITSLTPNHFILGRNNIDLFTCPPVDVTSLSKRWRYVQCLLDHIWTRWRKEYLPTIMQRSKWFQDTGNKVQKGQLVLLVNEGTPRNTWPMARIENLYPGKDGVIRVVDIKDAKGNIYKRPMVKVAPLEMLTSEHVLQGGGKCY